MSQGFIEAVPCPHCGHKNNLTGLHQDMGAGYGGSAAGLDTGTKVDCDKCSRVAAVTGVFKDPYIFIQGGGKKFAGELSNVMCPYCGKHMDFREVFAQLGDSLEPGVTAECDHCGNHSQVDKVIRKLRIRLAPV